MADLLVLLAFVLGPALLVLSLALTVAVALGWRSPSGLPWVLFCVGLALCFLELVAFVVVVDLVGG